MRTVAQTRPVRVLCHSVPAANSRERTPMTKNQDQRRRLFRILRRILVPPWTTLWTVKFQKNMEVTQ